MDAFRVAVGPDGAHLSQGPHGSVARGGSLRLVATASIYDRATLDDRLKTHGVSTAELILEAYRQWGEECPSKLDGDFAFAVYDAERHSLFAARDPFGARPLFYRSTGRSFELATGLPALKRSQDRLSDGAVADFLSGHRHAQETTFFEDVFRVPAAHRLTWRNGVETLSRYWEPRAVETAGDRADRVARFRELFHRATARRRNVAATQRVGALLSGGLDSSAIVCAETDPADDALSTYSLIFDRRSECDERRYIEAVRRRSACFPTLVARDDFAPLDGVDALFAAFGEPILAPNMLLLQPLYSRAASDGIGILLDGHGGDEVVSHGHGLLDDLMMDRRWRAAWRECAAVADGYGLSRRDAFLTLARRHDVVGSALSHRLLRVGKASVGVASAQHISAALRAAAGRRAPSDSAGPRSGRREKDQHRDTIEGAIQPYALEVLSDAGARHGMEMRFPFWDKDLVEFCLGVPAAEKLAGGRSRLIMRRAMADRLPDEVLGRTDKVDFTPAMAAGLVQHHAERIDALLQDAPGSLGDYVDMATARRSWSKVRSDPERQTGALVQQIWRIAALGTWLENRSAQRRPADPTEHSERRAPA